MAQFPVRVNVRAAQFPMLSRQFGRSIITERYDQHNMGLPQFTGSESQHDLGIPQSIYMENVLPTAAGYKSVCYVDRLLPCVKILPEACEIQHVVKDQYIMHSGTITTANIHNQAYAYNSQDNKVFQSIGNCEYLDVTPQECLKWENIIGITTINNRVVAYSTCEIFWGSIQTGDEFNFCMGLSGLAGSAKPIHLKGDIVRIFPLHEGAVIYTTENALYMEYNSRNMHMPYRFEPIPDVGGLLDWRHVAWESNSDKHIAYTTNGLQEVQKDRSDFIFPPVTEFLQGNVIERYIGSNVSSQRTSYDRIAYNLDSDCSTPCNGWSAATQIEQNTACSPAQSIACPQLEEDICLDGLKFKLNYAGSEYLCISYGCTPCGYEFVLVYDFKLRRWGKLRHVHVDVIESQDSIGLVHPDGSIAEVSLDHIKSLVNCQEKKINPCEGIIFFGRYQLDRQRISHIQEVELERIYPESQLKLAWLSAPDGANWLEDEIPCAVVNTESYRQYHIRRAGKTHSFKLEGVFDLNTIILTFTTGGSR